MTKTDQAGKTDHLSVIPVTQQILDANTFALATASPVLSTLLGIAPLGFTAKPLRFAPDPEWVIDTCSCCGGPCISNSRYVGGRGWINVTECWNSMPQYDGDTGVEIAPTCYNK